jgi:hypothetical protein
MSIINHPVPSAFKLVFVHKIHSGKWRIITEFIGDESSFCWHVEDNNKRICLSEEGLQREQWIIHIGWSNDPVPFEQLKTNRPVERNIPYRYYCSLKLALNSLYLDPLILLSRETGIIFSGTNRVAVGFCSKENFHYTHWEFSHSPDSLEIGRKIEVWLTQFEWFPSVFWMISKANESCAIPYLSGISIQKLQDPFAVHRAAVRAWLNFDEPMRKRCQYQESETGKTKPLHSACLKPIATSALSLFLVFVLRLGLGWSYANEPALHANGDYLKPNAFSIISHPDNRIWQELHQEHFRKIYPAHAMQSIANLLQVHSIGELSDFYWNGHSEGTFDVSMANPEQFDEIWQLLFAGSSKVGNWFQLREMRWLSRNSPRLVLRVNFQISWEGVSW